MTTFTAVKNTPFVVEAGAPGRAIIPELSLSLPAGLYKLEYFLYWSTLTNDSTADDEAHYETAIEVENLVAEKSGTLVKLDNDPHREYLQPLHEAFEQGHLSWTDVTIVSPRPAMVKLTDFSTLNIVAESSGDDASTILPDSYVIATKIR